MDVRKNSDELKKIRGELQWLSWGLVKIPLMLLAGFLVFQLINLTTAKPGENTATGLVSSLEELCATVDGRLAINVGNRTLYIDATPSYEELSTTEKWRFWDQNGDGIATEDEIESGIMLLEKSSKE